ncbi:MAG: ATP-binding protein [Thermoplasmatota archaeon]
MKGKVYRLMIVDDVEALRRLMRIGLQATGRFEIVGEAASGSAAIARAGESKPDVVLLDLSMPDMDGLEALPHILEASPLTRVVVFSGFNHVRMGPVAMRLGASAYVEKGVAPESLAETLLRVVEPAGEETGAQLPVEPPLRPGFAPPAAHSDGPATRPEAGPTPLHFLIVSSSPITIDRVAGAFDHGAVDAVPDARSARTRLNEQAYSAVFLDSSAYPAKAFSDDLLDILGHEQRAPVILLVDSLDSDLARVGIKAGVEDCIPLPAFGAPGIQRSALLAIERRRGSDARREAREHALEAKRLRDVEEEKSRFFSAAAHELNTPLTPIRLQLHLLKSHFADLAPEQQRSFELLERNVERLSNLTQELLDVARLQAGRFKLEPGPLNLQQVVQDVAETFAPVATANGIGMRTFADTPVVLQGDEKRITQVLYNLVSNALKYTPKGGHVTITLLERPDEVETVVIDDGIGFTGEQAKGLFVPFSRLHEGTKNSGSGTGLGLFVSKGIVELHGGRIWGVSAGPDKGSTFGFAIPVAGAREDPKPVVAPDRITEGIPA